MRKAACLAIQLALGTGPREVSQDRCQARFHEAVADPHHRRTPDVEGGSNRLLRSARVGLQEQMGTGQGAGCYPPFLVKVNKWVHPSSVQVTTYRFVTIGPSFCCSTPLEEGALYHISSVVTHSSLALFSSCRQGTLHRDTLTCL